ncbi:MAG: ThiF family adenylyltransferase [Candidatus Hydrogenedentota bacterium]
MINPYEHHWGRTELLVGAEGTAELAAARVAVYGLGGVGGYVAEALARAGVGYLRLVDGDVVAPSNRNRQLVALSSTEGQSKAEVMAARIRDINPNVQLEVHARFMTPGDVDAFTANIGYAIDAIDMVATKVALLTTLRQAGVFTVSCMGAACKRDPAGVRIADISETRECPLAKRVRWRLRRAGVATGITCVYSEERRDAMYDTRDANRGRKRFVQGSISYLPGIVGLTAAGVVAQQILAPRR